MPQVGELQAQGGKESRATGTRGICTDIGLRGRVSPASMGRHSDGILACLASSPVNMSLCGAGGWELTPQLSEYLFHEVGVLGGSWQAGVS